MFSKSFQSTQSISPFLPTLVWHCKWHLEKIWQTWSFSHYYHPTKFSISYQILSTDDPVLLEIRARIQWGNIWDWKMEMSLKASCIEYLSSPSPVPYPSPKSRSQVQVENPKSKVQRKCPSTQMATIPLLVDQIEKYQNRIDGLHLCPVCSNARCHMSQVHNCGFNLVNPCYLLHLVKIELDYGLIVVEQFL